jgi:hypothetical protein
VKDLAPAIQALEPLPRFRTEEGKQLLDVPRAPLPPRSSHAPARFLPKFDELLVAQRDRRRVMSDEHRRAVIHGGDVAATFLVDGVVAGTWSVSGGRVRIEPFEPVPRRALSELRAEGRRLEAFLR